MNCKSLPMVVIAIVFSCFVSFSEGQEQEDWIKKLQDRKTHFLFQTMYGLGVSEPTYRAILLDENGFVYDTTSILHAAWEEVGLGEEQVKQFRTIYLDSIEEMKRHPDSSILAKDQAGLETIFQAAQESIQAILTEEQLSRLNEIRHQKGVEQVGFARYFSSSHFAEGARISAEDEDALQNLAKRFAELRRANTIEQLKIANQELLKQLSAEKGELFENSVDIELKEKFLVTPMFRSKADVSKPYKSRKDTSTKLLNLRKVQKAIGLSLEQVTRIKELKGEGVEAQLAVLSDEQVEPLNQILIDKNLEQLGTVNSICNGRLRTILSLTEKEAQAIDEVGKQLFVELRERVANKNQQSLEAELNQLSADLGKRIRSALGRLQSDSDLFGER